MADICILWPIANNLVLGFNSWQCSANHFFMCHSIKLVYTVLDIYNFVVFVE